MKEEIWISQRVYTIQMLERFGMSKYKPRLILLSIEISLSSNDGPEIDEEKKEIKNITYYEALGLLI